MPRPKTTSRELELRKKYRREWIRFRKVNLFTQVRLAETLEISRRTVQMVENKKVNPRRETLRKFAALQAKYMNGNGKAA
jgi:DNA-binding XRE family transcriptional regulator